MATRLVPSSYCSYETREGFFDPTYIRIISTYEQVEGMILVSKKEPWYSTKMTIESAHFTRGAALQEGKMATTATSEWL